MRNQQQGNFIIIPEWLVERKDIRVNAKLLYGYVNAFCSQRKHCYFTNEQIAEKLGVSDRDARRLVAELIQANLITSVVLKGKKRVIHTLDKIVLPPRTPMSTTLDKIVLPPFPVEEDTNVHKDKEYNKEKGKQASPPAQKGPGAEPPERSCFPSSPPQPHGVWVCTNYECGEEYREMPPPQTRTRIVKKLRDGKEVEEEDEYTAYRRCPRCGEQCVQEMRQ
ncbi:helix-turn-helix domain-containing protein [Candidatus Saccharibacteria bacterium]|nr:helix-turn-helix domain-containing protein [Candidatus Saccharibacteria bacterium]